MARHARRERDAADPWAEGARPAAEAREPRRQPRAEEGSWLDDAFDERKAAADLEQAKASPLLGCGLVVAVAAALGLIVFAFAGILGALGA
ncbi:hypothetical protein [Enterorhabdus sp. P55]|uniref:hypothetical protein n=1 Tax=Enterorhabdus sp. P55 TaxID=2304571 RepID=UPI00137073F3|nr:hypothetical protein [Enterorhabdus sp. P55]MCI8452699.1 hypothetical protein [Eggerthellaceae bacterium]NBI31312.1 hypothetical protein [Enterorhabdus sp. P55]